MAQSMHCSCRRPLFGSQHLHLVARSHLTPALEDLLPFSDPRGTVLTEVSIPPLCIVRNNQSKYTGHAHAADMLSSCLFVCFYSLMCHVFNLLGLLMSLKE